jgi:diguanylate cyclase (GGDEF)-like protein
MKKKTRAAASGAAKSRKTAAAGRKAAPRRPPASVPPPPAALGDAKSTIRRLKTQLAQALARIDELQASAETDFLLDILNRRGFERELHRSIAYIKRYHASGALIILDVDRLKPVNDAFGHAAGDQVLKAIAATLCSQVRSSDVVGRLGGDEFALLLWNLSETDAKAKAAALEAAIDRLTFVFSGQTVAAGASAGVAILGPHAEAGRALEEADSAMYVRKAQRRHEGEANGMPSSLRANGSREPRVRRQVPRLVRRSSTSEGGSNP